MVFKIFTISFSVTFLFFGYVINDIYSLPKKNRKLGFNNCLLELSKERKQNCNNELCTISYSPKYESIRERCKSLE